MNVTEIISGLAETAEMIACCKDEALNDYARETAYRWTWAAADYLSNFNTEYVSAEGKPSVEQIKERLKKYELETIPLMNEAESRERKEDIQKATECITYAIEALIKNDKGYSKYDIDYIIDKTLGDIKGKINEDDSGNYRSDPCTVVGRYDGNGEIVVVITDIKNDLPREERGYGIEVIDYSSDETTGDFNYSLSVAHNKRTLTAAIKKIQNEAYNKLTTQ